MSKHNEAKRCTVWPGSSSSSPHSKFKNKEQIQRQPTIASLAPKPTKRRSFESDSAKLRNLQLVAEHSTSRSNKRITRHTTSPWSSYESLYRVELCGTVAVVRKLSNPKPLFMIKSTKQISNILEASQVRKHPNICQIYEIFHHEEASYIVMEDMAISLIHVVGCPRRTKEHELSLIAKQALDGLLYLKSQDLTFRVTCSNVLISLQGIVKLSVLEDYTENLVSERESPSSALGMMLVSIINKREKLQRPYKLLNLAEWSPDALDFISMTECGMSLGDLAAHTFVSQIHGDADLEWYVMYVMRTTRVLSVD